MNYGFGRDVVGAGKRGKKNDIFIFVVKKQVDCVLVFMRSAIHAWVYTKRGKWS